MLLRLAIAGAISLTFPQVKAQADIVTEGAIVVKNLYTAARWTHDNWKFISWVVTGRDYRWWACIYRDGFVTYNNFRSYRTAINAYSYFVKGQGDCDAVYGNQGRHICYSSPIQARRYSEQHGAIVDIQYQDDSGRYHSIFEY